MQLFDNQNNADSVVISLLKELAINIKSEDIIAELEKHPDYPSMLAISDVLNRFEIDKTAYRIGTGEVRDVPVPFIAHTRLNDFVSVSKITGSQVTLSDDKRKNYKMPLAKFENLFDGVVLTFTPSLSGYDTSRRELSNRLSEYSLALGFFLLGMVLLIVFFI